MVPANSLMQISAIRKVSTGKAGIPKVPAPPRPKHKPPKNSVHGYSKRDGRERGAAKRTLKLVKERKSSEGGQHRVQANKRMVKNWKGQNVRRDTARTNLEKACAEKKKKLRPKKGFRKDTKLARISHRNGLRRQT